MKICKVKKEGSRIQGRKREKQGEVWPRLDSWLGSGAKITLKNYSSLEARRPTFCTSIVVTHWLQRRAD